MVDDSLPLYFLSNSFRVRVLMREGEVEVEGRSYGEMRERAQEAY